jgi:hypothetical protein
MTEIKDDMRKTRAFSWKINATGEQSNKKMARMKRLRLVILNTALRLIIFFIQNQFRSTHSIYLTNLKLFLSLTAVN